jgi:hypothetical protein
MAQFANEWGPQGISYPNGQRAVNRSYTVKFGGNLIPLFADKDRAVSKPNPGVTDSVGNIFFFANPGTYDLEIDEFYDFPITVQLHPDEVLGGGGGPPNVGFEVNVINQTLVQVLHGFTWKPAGVEATELDGVTRVFPERITHPVPGVTEVTFGFSFSGKVLVS